MFLLRDEGLWRAVARRANLAGATMPEAYPEGIPTDLVLHIARSFAVHGAPFHRFRLLLIQQGLFATIPAIEALEMCLSLLGKLFPAASFKE